MLSFFLLSLEWQMQGFDPLLNLDVKALADGLFNLTAEDAV